MFQIVSTPAQAHENIERFQDEVDRSPELQARLPYARAWYAVRNSTGLWRFGPSKFVGYVGLDAESYLRTAQETDGRRTEAQLRTCFKTIDPTHPLHAELSSELVGFLAKYGKTPSTKVRINISRPSFQRFLPAERSADGAPSALVNMIVEVARTLPTEHFHDLLERLEDIWS